MLFNGGALIITFPGTQVRIAEHERLQSYGLNGQCAALCCSTALIDLGLVHLQKIENIFSVYPFQWKIIFKHREVYILFYLHESPIQ